MQQLKYQNKDDFKDKTKYGFQTQVLRTGDYDLDEKIILVQNARKHSKNTRLQLAMLVKFNPQVSLQIINDNALSLVR